MNRRDFLEVASLGTASLLAGNELVVAGTPSAIQEWSALAEPTGWQCDLCNAELRAHADKFTQHFLDATPIFRAFPVRSVAANFLEWTCCRPQLRPTGADR